MAAGDYDALGLMRAMRAAGFRQGGGLIIGFAVSTGENTSRNLTAVYTNDDEWDSRDRGPWQINDHWHPEVTDQCAFDLECSTVAAYRISNQGRSWSPWSAYNNGRYNQFMELGYNVYALDEALKARDRLQADNSVLQNRIGDLEGQLDEKDALIASLQSQIGVLQTTVADLQRRVATAEADLATMTADRDRIKAAATSARNTLNGVL